MKKRMISALMAVMVASSLLVGCGGKGRSLDTGRTYGCS